MLLQNNLQGLQHLGLPVTDQERSLAFYANLGFAVTMRTDLPSELALSRWPCWKKMA
jgi:catechol 2,3-dioxygenase-like lactoylglutathione lyase family enzyme